ncbi:transmembrane protein, putative [Medicago truncatula]|uniref:Transmembrane protein, putative n=1 Tax=Medicago truncatula TaxID=3880 RepID=A0A072VCI6_MEDTR|nr:transmembrane protein, putative [Medicago truncatula]
MPTNMCSGRGYKFCLKKGEECNTVVIIAWNIKLGLVSSTLTLLRAPRTLEHNTT